MERQKIFSIALILAALVWPAGLARTVEGQTRGRGYVADTRVFRLGPGQTLRLTINGQAGSDTLNVRFKRMYYVGSANGGVWKGSVAAQDTSVPITVAADEAVSTDASQGGYDGVRIEAVIRGYTGTTHVNEGVLQIINSDGSVAAVAIVASAEF